MLLRTPYDIRKARTQGWRILVAEFHGGPLGERCEYHIAGSPEELRRAEGFSEMWTIRPYEAYGRDLESTSTPRPK